MAADTAGLLWQTLLRRTGRRFSLRYPLTGNDDDFQTAAGFISRPGIISGNVNHQLALYGKSGGFIEKWTGDVQLHGTWNHRGFFNGEQALERKLHLNNNFITRGGWQTGFSVLIERYGFDPAPYRNYAVLDGETLRPFTGGTLPKPGLRADVQHAPRARALGQRLLHLGAGRELLRMVLREHRLCDARGAVAAERAAARGWQLQPAVVLAAHRRLVRRHPAGASREGGVPGHAGDLRAVRRRRTPPTTRMRCATTREPACHSCSCGRTARSPRPRPCPSAASATTGCSPTSPHLERSCSPGMAMR